MENNMTNKTRRGGIIDKDNAHLTERSNRCVAVSNCYRLAVTETGRTGRRAGAADVTEIMELLREVIDLLGGVLCYSGGYSIKREM
jgi:hypothetical protein